MKQNLVPCEGPVQLREQKSLLLYLKFTFSDSPFRHYLDNTFMVFSLAPVPKTDSVKGDLTQAISDLLCHLPRNRQFLFILQIERKSTSVCATRKDLAYP